MIIEAPIFVPPSLPTNRPFEGDRIGGGGTAAPVELPRAIGDIEQAPAGRRAESESNSNQRSTPNEAELAAQARFSVALQTQSVPDLNTSLPGEVAGSLQGTVVAAPASVDPSDDSATELTTPGDDDVLISPAQFAQLRDQIELQLSEGPSGLTLRSVDEFI